MQIFSEFRIAGAFNSSMANRGVAFDISNDLGRVWHSGLLHKRKSYGISSQIFGLISFFLGNRRLRVVLDGVSSQEYPLMTFPMISVILLSMLMILLFTLTVIRHRLCGNN